MSYAIICRYYYSSNTTGSALTLLRISRTTTAVVVTLIVFLLIVFILPNNIGNLYDRPTLNFIYLKIEIFRHQFKLELV